jgi:hypothetical protein
VDYVLSEDAISSSSVLVQEVGEEGSVPEIQVENKGPTRVLFIEGELLTGAKQDRILNTSMLIPAAARIAIPVSCVEQGRWAYRSRRFSSSGDYSSSSLRYVMRQSVTASTRGQRGHRSDQWAVWNAVAEQQATLGVDSDTSALSDSFVSFQKEVRRHQEELKYPKQATGLAIAIGPKLVSVDLFDKPDTCERVWERLLSGTILESLQVEEQDVRPAPEDITDFLNQMERTSWAEVPAVGEGEEYRAESEDNHGSVLFLQDSLVHLSVLAAR